MTDLHLIRPGADLAYSIDGEGDRALVAAHGLTSSRAAEDASGVFGWAPVAQVERLVRYDARGHGASTARPVADDWHWPALADDYLAVADAVSATAPVDGLGSSMGCGTVLWAATAHPERFRRLVLVIPPTAWATRQAQVAQYLAGAAFVEQRGLAAWVRGAATLPPHPILAAGGLPTALDPQIPEPLIPTVLRGAAGTDLPPEEAIARLPHETLILPWAEDPGHPVSTAERLHALIPNSTLEIATTPDHLRGWGARVAAFLAR